MTMTRRTVLRAIGGAAAVPLAWSRSFHPFSASALLDGSLDGALTEGSDLDRSLNATPAWSLELSGVWKLAKDPANRGKAEEWFKRGPVSDAVEQKIPNPLQLAFSGYNGVAWYWRSFDVPNPEGFDDLRIRFEGADYFAEAWLNGQHLGGNESALLPFAFDARRAVKAGHNDLVVRIIDACYAQEIDGFRLGSVPGGRQHDNPWEPGFRHFNYGGLLLPVSVEAFRRPWIADAFIRPSVSGAKIDVDLTVIGKGEGTWAASVKPKSGGGAATHKKIALQDDAGKMAFSMTIDEPHSWDVWDGFLYELELAPETGGTVWRGTFGLREVSIIDGRIAINGKPILQRSFLYNQIWPGTLGVPGEDFARRDIELARKTNANMLRCFSKTPLAATVRAADELGILLQHESLGSWYLKNGDAEDRRLCNITARAVLAYRNHPSILWWNVLNENAPIFDPKRSYPTDEMTLGPYVLRSVLPELHALDPTRPVIANDPVWHDVDNVWEPGKGKPSLPLVQDHYYQFTGLEVNEDSWEKVRQRKWGAAENPSAAYLGITEWGVNSSPEWTRLLESYKTSGLPQDADDYVLYRTLHQRNVHYYEASGVKEQGFPTFESVQEANREYVAWRYREQMALYWGNLHSVGHGLTSLDDSSYELSGVVDTWRNPKPVVFETITELNRPLQVNLWARPSCVYTGDNIELDATLVNERQRLAQGTYTVTLSLLNENDRAVHRKEHSHVVGTDPIEHLITDTIPAHAEAGRYRVVVELAGGAQQLRAERPVVIFDRKPKDLRMQNNVWVWEKGDALRSWLSARSIQARGGGAGEARRGDLMLVAEADAHETQSILKAVRSGATAVILAPERVFHQETAGTADAMAPARYSELLEPLAGNWKPELRKIDWWGAPSAWGYTRTPLALQHAYLAGLPQAKALEAQPEYQRVAPAYTWVMGDVPSSIRISHAVLESSLAVDMPYSSDLFSVAIGSGAIVLNTLRIGPSLHRDPAADLILENIVCEICKRGNDHAA